MRVDKRVDECWRSIHERVSCNSHRRLSAVSLYRTRSQHMHARKPALSNWKYTRGCWQCQCNKLWSRTRKGIHICVNYCAIVNPVDSIAQLVKLNTWGWLYIKACLPCNFCCDFLLLIKWCMWTNGQLDEGTYTQSIHVYNLFTRSNPSSAKNRTRNRSKNCKF
jgi:hypothetical protein